MAESTRLMPNPARLQVIMPWGTKYQGVEGTPQFVQLPQDVAILTANGWTVLQPLLVTNPEVLAYTDLEAMAAAGQLPPGSMITADSLPFWCVDGSNFVAMDGEALPGATELVLLIGASTYGRANNLHQVDLSASFALNGQLTIKVNDGNLNWRVGRLVRTMSNKNFPKGFEQLGKVTSVTKFTGYAVVTMAYVDYQGNARPNVSAGTWTGSDGFVGDMQSWSNNGGWPQKLQQKLGNRIRCVVLGTPGTNLDDWLSADRIAQVRSYGRVGAIVFDCGAGNSINSAGDSGEVALAKHEQLVRLYRQQAPVIISPDLPALSSLQGGGQPTTETFVAGSIYNAGLHDLAQKYPFFKVAQVGRHEMANFGRVTDADQLNGWAPMHRKADDGVHCVDATCEIWATEIAAVLTPFYNLQAKSETLCAVDRRSVATGGDPDGNKVRNILQGVYGNVALSGANIPTSMQVLFQALPVGSTGSAYAQQSESGYLDVIADVVVPEAGTGQLTSAIALTYAGDANSLLAAWTDPANIGKQIDLIIEAGVTGFEDSTGDFIDVSLYLDNGDGLGLVMEASASSPVGAFSNNNMTAYTDGLKGFMEWPQWGGYRFPRIEILAGNYTAATIQIAFHPLQGSTPNNFQVRFGGDLQGNIID